MLQQCRTKHCFNNDKCYILFVPRNNSSVAALYAHNCIIILYMYIGHTYVIWILRDVRVQITFRIFFPIELLHCRRFGLRIARVPSTFSTLSCISFSYNPWYYVVNYDIGKFESHSFGLRLIIYTISRDTWINKRINTCDIIARETIEFSQNWWKLWSWLRKRSLCIEQALLHAYANI